MQLSILSVPAQLRPRLLGTKGTSVAVVLTASL